MRSGSWEPRLALKNQDHAIRGRGVLNEGRMDRSEVENTIITIDSSQGAEANIITLCCVRAHKSMGFMNHRSRPSLATSRHREGLCIIGKWDHISRVTDQGNWIGHPLSVMRQAAFVALGAMISKNRGS